MCEGLFQLSESPDVLEQLPGPACAWRHISGVPFKGPKVQLVEYCTELREGARRIETPRIGSVKEAPNGGSSCLASSLRAGHAHTGDRCP